MSRRRPGPGREEEPEGLPVRIVRSVGQTAAVLVGLALLAAVSGVLLLSQTAPGREAVASLLEETLDDAVQGRVEVGTITGGNLITRSSLDRFRITDEEGRTFLDLRDVRVSYSPFGLLTGRIHLRRMSVGELDLRLLQDSGGSWNFERIFAADTSGAADPGGLRLLVTDLRVDDGGLEVRMPWTPDATGAAGDSLRQAALRGEEIWRYEQTGDGVEQVISLTGLSGRMPFLRLVDPERDMRMELERVDGRLAAVSRPLALTRLDATAILGDTVRIALRQVEAGRSRLRGPGWVVPGDPPRFRFDLDADRLDFEDLGWLPVPVPREGGGPARLILRTVEEGEVTVVEARDGRFRSGDSRVDGGFTLFLEETPRLEDVDLELDPLRLGLVNRLLEQPEAPDGWVEGRVTGAGPLDLFRLDASVRLRRPAADTTAVLPGAERGRGPPSSLTARGGLGLTEEPRQMDDLRLDFEAFEPYWTRLVGVDTGQRGRITGTATLDRTAEGRIAFSADLRRRAPGDSTSSVRGSGSFVPGDPARVDVELEARPLSLSVLDPYFPALDLMGTIRGPLSATGTLADLQAQADLETPRGHLRFDGRFDLAAERKRYDASVVARDIQLRQWVEEGPFTRLAVRGRVIGVGTDPEDLEATFDLEVLPSSVEGAAVDSSLLRFTVEEGLARVDTFAIRTEVGTLRGRGGFGLAESRSAALYLTVDAPDLSTWNRWIVPGRNPARPDTATRDLFALFPQDLGATEEGEEVDTAPPDSLAGSLHARGVLYGNPTSMGFGGSLSGAPVSYGGTRADSLHLTLDAPDARGLDSLVVSGQARGLVHGVQRADSASFRLERRGPHTSAVRVRAARGDRVGIRAGGIVTWTDERRTAELDDLELRLGGQRLRLGEPATVAYGDSGLSVSGLSMTGERGTRIRASGDIPLQGDARFDLELERVDLAELTELLAVGQGARGHLGGSLAVRGTAASPRFDATFTVDSAGFEDRVYRRLEARLAYDDRQLSGHVGLTGESGELVRLEGNVRADLAFREVERRLLEEPLDLTLSADSLPLELVTMPLEAVRDVDGHGSGSVRITGSPDDPQLDGRITLRDGRALVVPLAVVYRDIRGSIGFLGSEATVDSLTAVSAAGGRATVRGTVGLASLTVPTFDLRVRARELQAIQRRRLALAVDGQGTLSGDFESPNLDGSFRLSDGTIRTETFTRREDVVDLTDPELVGLVDTTTLAEERLLNRVQNPFVQNLRARLDLQIGPDLWLRSPDLQVELAGDLELRLDRARQDVTVFGDVELVRGTYRWTWGPRGAFSRQLRITEGRIEFVGTPGVNPNLDITASHRSRTGRGNFTVRVQVTGTMLAPSLALTSEPPMSESDQVCVLLMNSPCGAPGAGQLARDQLLGRVSSELSSALASEVGIDYLEVRSTGPQGGTDEQMAGAETTERSLFSETEVEAGWYLSPEVFLTVTYPVGYPFPEGRLDWRFADAWSLELLSELRLDEPLGRRSDSNLGRQRRWGLFLFRDWSF